ncbi:glycosyltransferase [Actinosynnema sp.]|uniref:glycosyltransferase n=1 Tax=Actinosynnema sp. TaxID=1872144 RepID=UPI003F85547E
MRVLFAALASPGHTFPMIPLAVAIREAGHEVHFAAGEGVHAALAAQDLRPFRPADAFYELYPEDLEPELARLEPDLVVHGWGVPGAAVAAERAGIPALWHGFGRMFDEGIGFDRPFGTGRPHLDVCPPSLQDKEFMASERRVELRPVALPEPGAVPERDASKPLVYLTLGTAFATAGLLSTAVRALAGVGAQVVVSTGRVHPQELGPLPEGVTAHEWVSQGALLPHASVVVHHGGSGTTLASLATGVPQLFLPQGADQFSNADAVSAAGAGVALRGEQVTAEAITASVRKLLSPKDGAGHREAARAIAEEIAGMPAPSEVARQLPELAAS